MAALPSERRFEGILPEKRSADLPDRTTENSTAFEKNLKSIFFRNKRRDDYFHPLLL